MSASPEVFRTGSIDHAYPRSQRAERRLDGAPSADGGGVLALFPATLMMFFFVLPLGALAVRWLGFASAAGAGSFSLSATVQALSLSIATTLVTVLVTFLLGTPLAWILATRRFRGKPIITVFVELPLVMPPVVAGLALLVAFGRNGLLGSHLAEAGVTIAMTPVAVVAAQLFVASPYYIRAAQLRFAAIPPELREAANIDGAGDRAFFWKIVMPLSGKALLSGMILTWARALGEFGATILFAGNLAGRTRTMPSLVYTALEQDFGASFSVAMVLLLFAAVALAVVRTFTYLDEVQNGIS